MDDDLQNWVGGSYDKAARIPVDGDIGISFYVFGGILLVELIIIACLQITTEALADLPSNCIPYVLAIPCQIAAGVCSHCHRNAAARNDLALKSARVHPH
jgi:hypothetical protein